MRYFLALILLYSLCIFSLLPSVCIAESQYDPILSETISKKQDLRLKVFSSSDSREVSVRLILPKSHITTPEIFVIENPTRLVIDIPNIVLTIARSYSLQGNNLLHSVRVGSHPGKVRLVLDLAVGPHEFSHSLVNSPEGFSIVLSTGQDAHALVTPSAIPAHAQSVVPSLAPSPTQPTAVTPTLAATATVPAALPAIAPTELPSPQATTLNNTIPPGQLLSLIAFDYLEPKRTPAVRLAFTERPQFKLTKVNESAFKLSVPKAMLADKPVGLPQFPPQDFVGFTLIHATPRESRLEIIIGVDRGVKISAITKDNEIIIRVATP